MAIFNDKIISAKFLDYPNNMLIELLYREGDVVTPYILEVDFTNQDFSDMLKDITLEDIENTTIALRKSESAKFEKMINAEVDRRLAETENIRIADPKDNFTGKSLLDLIESKNMDNDFVFGLKIAVLEDNDISGSKDKLLKLSIRKSKSVIELLKVYLSVKE